MTDRYDAFVVEMESDIREDDAERLIEVLRHLKGVANVVPHVVGWEALMQRDRVRLEVEEKLLHAVRDILRGGTAGG